jgi:DHA2 family multidrug resistance protein-like MFS transporter
MAAIDAETPKAGRREWIGLAVIALPCLLYSMDLTVLNLALPKLSADLRPSATQLLWIVDIYGFLVAGSLITMGNLGDRIGRRKLLLIGAVVFGVASVIAAFAQSAEMLIAARALLGVAGATVAPSTLSLIRNMFHDPAERTFAIGVWGTSYAAGGLVGPVVGGLLLQFFWWGSVFLIAVPVMVLVLAVGPRLLPEYRDPGTTRLDVLSVVLSLAAVLSAVYGLKFAAENGWGMQPVAFIAAGIALGAVFLRRQRTLPDPLIDLKLFRSPAFSAALATNVLGVFIVFGSFVFVAQYMQLVLGLSPLEAALWNLPPAVGVTAGSMLAPAIVRRVPAPYVLAAGLTLCAIGFALLTRVGTTPNLILVVIATTVMTLGLGPVFILTTDLIVGAAPPQRAGAAAAISETGGELGGVLGIATLGSIGVAIYRGAMARDLPADVPAAAATAARDTLGGAFAVAAELPDRIGAAVLAAARGAFSEGMVLVAVICAVIAVGTAIMAGTILRKVPAGAARET